MERISIEQIKERLLASGARRELSPEGYCRSAVLVPLVEINGGCDLLLTRRTELVETHKGQVCFPGGTADADDETSVATALREAQEELGIAPGHVDVLGLLDDMTTPSGFVITPVVGHLRALPELVPNPHEVAEAFLVPLEFFLDPAQARSEIREVRGLVREVWFYRRGTHEIWGATAFMIRSLLLRTGFLQNSSAPP